MVETVELLPGVVLRCCPVERFKQGCLSIQFLRPMCRQEAALNAVLPAVLLRGSERHPDLRAITLRLDELYGASVHALVRRVGDVQAVGFLCGMIEDRFALPGERVLEPMVEFLEELLFAPRLEGGMLCPAYVQSEQENLIAEIDAQRNDKRAYSVELLLERMGRADSFGIPRTGDRMSAQAITPESCDAHYRRVLRESPVEIFYVGSNPPQETARLLRKLFAGRGRDHKSLPATTPFHDVGGGDVEQCVHAAQGNLAMGFVTPITNRDPRFAAMQVLNTLYGGGMTSKLFSQVRERLSLCYGIGSSYYGSKGVGLVTAGIDNAQRERVQSEILAQLDACRRGEITDEELRCAKASLLSGYRAVFDSPGSVESYCATAAIGGIDASVEARMAQVAAVDASQVVAAAQALRLHSTCFLKGVES